MTPGYSRYLLLLMAMIAMHSVPAQSKYAIGSFASWPVGSFASTHASDGSFAQPGWGVVFEDEAHLRTWPPIFSMGLHISYQQNAMDNTAMEREFSKYFGARTEVSEAKYRPLLVTLGPFFDIPLSPRLDLGIKTGIGFALTNIDSFTLAVQPPAGGLSSSYDVAFKTSPAFTYLLGLNAEFKASDIVGLMLFMDFSGARSKVDSFVGTIGRTQSDFDLLFINTGLGMTIKFD